MALVRRPGGMLRRVAVLVALCGCYSSVNTIVEGRGAIARSGSKKRRKQQPLREQPEQQRRQSSSFSIGFSSSIHGGISLSDRWQELRHEHHHKQSLSTTTNDRVTAVAVDVTEFRDDGFLLYLQQYEEEEEEKRTAARTRLVLEQRRQQRGRRKMVLRTIVGSALVVGAATWFWTTGGGGQVGGGSTETVLYAQSLWMDLKRTTGAAIAVNLVGAMYRQFFRSGSSATRAAQMQNKLDNPWIWLVVVTTSMTRPDLWFHVLWDTVLPTTARTFRHMLVAELWNRAFARFFALAGPVLVAALVGHDDNHDDEEQGGQQQDHALLVWMEQDRSFVAMAIKRGTKKLFQSVLQKHLHRAVLYVWDRATEAIQGVVQQLFPSVAVVV